MSTSLRPPSHQSPREPLRAGLLVELLVHRSLPLWAKAPPHARLVRGQLRGEGARLHVLLHNTEHAPGDKKRQNRVKTQLLLRRHCRAQAAIQSLVLDTPLSNVS